MTGGNSGLGLETVRALASVGATVLMGARDTDKAERARAAIAADHPAARVEIVPLDLADLASVRRAATSVVWNHPRLDLLVNNAGVMVIPESKTVDGFERQFGTNHLGHWALTAHLMPAILAAHSARVVTVTSIARLNGRLRRIDDPDVGGRYSAWQAYANAKLANYVFGLGLQHDFVANCTRAMSLLAHPGYSDTGTLTAGSGLASGIGARLNALVSSTPAEGAMPQIRAATDPDARGGTLYAPLLATVGRPVVRPVLRGSLLPATARLWRLSERKTGIPLVIRA